MKRSILQERYPFNDSIIKSLWSSLLFGTFIFLFLFLFQPFGLQNYQSPNKNWQLVGYGAVTFCVLFFTGLLFQKLFPKWYCKSNWNVGKNILYTLLIFVLIGSGNVLFAYSQGFIRLNFNNFLIYQGLTLLIGLFPVILSTLFVYNQRLSKMVKQAQLLNQSIPHQEKVHADLIQIPSQNKSENFSTDLNKLLAIKSVENYVEIYCLVEGDVQKKILRNTLKNITSYLEEFKFIKKCHRSYLVNLEQVEHFEGNAQGLKLKFRKPIDFEVPVSRSFVNLVKQQLS